MAKVNVSELVGKVCPHCGCSVLTFSDVLMEWNLSNQEDAENPVNPVNMWFDENRVMYCKGCKECVKPYELIDKVDWRKGARQRYASEAGDSEPQSRWVCPDCGHIEFVILTGVKAIEVVLSDDGLVPKTVRDFEWVGLGCVCCKRMLRQMDLREEWEWYQSKYMVM